MKRRIVLFGFLIGLLTSVPAIVLLAAAERLAGLPFLPFDLFDLAARALPGPIITFGIDLMVGAITALKLGNTSAAAKFAEQSMAILQFVLAGGILGAVIGAFRPQVENAELRLLGLAAGFVLSIPFVGAQAAIGFPGGNPILGIVWAVCFLSVWGLILGWILMDARRAAQPAAGQQFTRRQLLTLAATGLLALIGSAVGLRLFVPRKEQTTAVTQPSTGDAVDGALGSPSADVLAARFEPAPGTRPEIIPTADFYRIDINTRIPQLDAEEWRLELTGLVRTPMSLTLEEIRARPKVSQYLTLSCISNTVGGDLIGTTLWSGTRLKDLLEDAGLMLRAKALDIVGADRFHESVVLEDMLDERTLLAYEMNGEALPAKHGFPLRILIPNRYGMKQPKWITRMEAVAEIGPGYWVDRGWNQDARPRTVSVIDNVTIESETSGNTLLGGIAWAGSRGISRVEVRVDDEPWTDAELRNPPISPLTWVQWRYVTAASTGKHTAYVRAYDGSGLIQLDEENPPHPSGATGIHEYAFNV